jgi:hypothetical protein
MKIDIYLDAGKKRTFAGATDWPGWCRSGKDEPAALDALLEYAPRYAKVLNEAEMEFDPPTSLINLKVNERLQGNATTDFGAPGIAPSSDRIPLSKSELDRLKNLLRACWKALDAARNAIGQRELRKGPRGGGRETNEIIQHLAGADKSYLSALGWKYTGSETDTSPAVLEALRSAIIEGLEAATAGKIAPTGPRGGTRWTPRYLVRRVAWHTLDHAWEIEDRM